MVTENKTKTKTVWVSFNNIRYFTADNEFGFF
jgi:hypothetical protein